MHALKPFGFDKPFASLKTCEPFLVSGSLLKETLGCTTYSRILGCDLFVIGLGVSYAGATSALGRLS